MTDVFSPSVKNSAGTYGWSNPKNWSAGIPGRTDSVSLGGTGYGSLLDMSVTINALTVASGVGLSEAASQSLTVTSGAILGSTDTFVIGANSYAAASTLVGGSGDTVSLGSNGILTIAGAMTLGAGSMFTTATSTGTGYATASSLTLGSSSVLSVGDRLALANGLTLGDNGLFTTAGATADLEVDHVTLGSSDAVAFGAGTVSIANALTVGSNDTVGVASGVGFTAGSVVLGSDAVLDIRSGTVLSASAIGRIGAMGSGAAIVVEGTAQAGDSAGGSYTVRNNGSLDFTGSLSGPSSFGLAGGTLALGNLAILAAGTGFAFSGTAGSTLAVAGTGDFTSTGSGYSFGYAITGFDYGDVLQFPALALLNLGSAAYNSVTHSIVVKSLIGSTIFTVGNVSLAADVTTATFRLGSNSITLACFLSGTLIETAAGARPVETLRAGDAVVTIENGAPVIRAARWIGTRTVDLDENEAGHELSPIRIRANAFADGQPMRDLLVTPDHCVLVEGGLVPARMLVNHGSIVRDDSLRRFSVHHVEFDRHAILLSEGLPTESYLDTGNRDDFGDAADDATRQPQGWAEAAAPLSTEQAFVEPIWHGLAARAVMLGLAGPVDEVATTADAQLRLRLQDGRLLGAARRNGDRYFFVLPAGTRQATIESRIFIPALVEGPFVDDRRRLGVAVSGARLWKSLGTESIPLDPALPGWHAAEPGAALVWTDGAGVLQTGSLSRQTMLELTIATAGAYLLDAPPAPSRAA